MEKGTLTRPRAVRVGIFVAWLLWPSDGRDQSNRKIGAIEIYNKPRFEYRSECFVILLLNSWELLFKAILSKNRVRIFEPKVRGKPYFTLRFFTAMDVAEQFFPKNISHRAVSENIGRLSWLV
ncbi:DUF3644 domain-containing protein [Undibacterium sp. Jales W-56]|uniref:DUF3644 domain-containing protein n=1 Tax=Undibacterium sp. Jales W-56 TaxID=2897325 RepID=UPI003977C94A